MARQHHLLSRRTRLAATGPDPAQFVAGDTISFDVSVELIPHLLVILFIGGPFGEEPGWRRIRSAASA